MEKSIHSKIINQVAKDILKPIGICRKGQSRTWLDDNVWFTTIIEYQPSFWSKGTHLNIGINFNWYLQEHFSFDYGYRESEFVGFKNIEQFQLKVTELSSKGLAKILEYRNFIDINYAKNKILSYKFDSDDLWGNYHRALICLLTSDNDNFLIYCNKIKTVDSNFEWIQKLKDNVDQLLLIYKNKTQVIDYLAELIRHTRELKKLTVVEKEVIRGQIIDFMN